ncbi:MAG: manganese efflux pump MntP family protein [Dysosmobacter sp.]|nr:manganese efflux pump MntP family protein [Dysosmobacter sp.]
MKVWELFVIAVGLSMDAFAVSICKGLSTKDVRREHMVVTGLYFGGFQALMPLAGYLLGSRFQSMIQRVDHWIAFVLLALIGANMVRESQGEAEHLDDSFTPGTMLPLAVATSIDALAVGVTFAFLNVRIIPAAALIGVTTFALSAIGVRLGSVFGARYQARAELAGGIVLILMGVKILLEHTGILG